MSAFAAWPHGDPRDVVRAVLSDARYRSAPQRPGEQSWLDALIGALHRLWDWIVAPFRDLTGGGSLANIVAVLVVAGVLIAVVFGLVLLLHAAIGERVARRRATASAALDVRDARALRDAAIAAADAGRFRDAAVLLWLSALHALDERDRVRFDPARSPGEWQRAVRDPAFDALARDAVVALFGDRAVDATLVERMRRAYDRVAADG